MKDFISVRPEDLTFAELRARTGSTAGMRRLPRPEKLARSQEKICISSVTDDAEITVYENGLILFSADGHQTVFAVDRCALKGADGKVPRTDEGLAPQQQLAAFDPLPWVIPVEAVGLQRIDHNSINSGDSRIAFRLDDENIANDAVLCVPGAEAVYFDDEAQQSARKRAQKRAAVRRSLAALTDRQRSIVQLFYVEKLTQKAVAKRLGIGQPAVSRHLKAIEKKFLKNCENFLRE